MKGKAPEMKKPRSGQASGLFGDNVINNHEENVAVTNSEKDHMIENITAAVQVAPETMPAITYAGRPVVTTALLAKLYGTDSHNIIKNFTANDGRFTAGKHYHKLEGAELKAFKDSVSQSYSVNDKVTFGDVVQRRARHLILWTERGAARHAKMLDTDQAWEVFERLEDCYFGKVEQANAQPARSKPKALPHGLATDQQDSIKALVKARVEALPKDKQAKAAITCWSALKSKFGCSYKEIAPEQFTDAVSLVARLPLEGELLGREEPAKSQALSEDDLAFLYSLCASVMDLVGVGERLLPAMKELNSITLINVPNNLNKCRTLVGYLYQFFGRQMEVEAKKRGLFINWINLAAAEDRTQPIYLKDY